MVVDLSSLGVMSVSGTGSDGDGSITGIDTVDATEWLAGTSRCTAPRTLARLCMSGEAATIHPECPVTMQIPDRAQCRLPALGRGVASEAARGPTPAHWRAAHHYAAKAAGAQPTQRRREVARRATWIQSARAGGRKSPHHLLGLKRRRVGDQGRGIASRSLAFSRPGEVSAPDNPERDTHGTHVTLDSDESQSRFRFSNTTILTQRVQDEPAATDARVMTREADSCVGWEPPTPAAPAAAASLAATAAACAAARSRSAISFSFLLFAVCLMLAHFGQSLNKNLPSSGFSRSIFHLFLSGSFARNSASGR